ncbi:MAG: site-specific integrase [Clostridiales bacterium]|nr:site-specific integrase [Clostridiales bacterium]
MPIYKTKSKKNGKQQYRVRINYTDNTGTQRQLTRIAYGAAEASDLERRLYEEIKQTPVEKKLTLRTMYDEYFDSVKSDFRETTLDKKRQMFENVILPEVGDIKLSDFDIPAAQKWKNNLSSRDYTCKTCQNYYTQFSAMLSFAVKMGYIPRNPLQALGNFRNSEFELPQEKLHYYTAEQVKKYLLAAYNTAKNGTITDWGYYVFFALAVYTGARKGEINALKWSDIDNNIIHIRRSLTQKIKGDDIETAPKNRSSYRDLQMPEPLIKILDEHRLRHKTDTRFSEDFRVCGGVTALRDTSIELRNTTYAKAAELPHIRIHDFRHTHASLLVNEGINIQEIARRLGHSNVETTWQTYAHLYPREEERAVKILNNICF